MRHVRWLSVVAFVMGIVVPASVASAAGRKSARPPIIRKIVITGNDKVSSDTIMQAIEVRPGDEFDPEQLDRDVKRIKRVTGIADVIYKTKRVKRGIELTFEVLEGNAPEAPVGSVGETLGSAREAPESEAGAAAPAKAADAASRDAETPAPVEPPPIPGPTGTPGIAKVGIVDWDRIRAEWEAVKALQERRRRLSQLPALRQRELEYRAQLISLTEVEAERVIELWRKERLTDKQKKELADLQERARQRDQEFAALQSKANRTEQEQERFVLLKETRDNRQRQLRELERQYALEIQEADKQLNAKDREATMKVREIVAEVAKKLGLELVFEADRVLYGGLDITTQVIERLNQEPYAVFEPGE